MVAIADIPRINSLTAELQEITSAVALFDDGGRIANMTVVSAEGAMPAMLTSVATATMDYPPQMVTAIKGYLTARADDIRKELADLGVTGIEP